jgi:hypothetical protein
LLSHDFFIRGANRYGVVKKCHVFQRESPIDQGLVFAQTFHDGLKQPVFAIRQREQGDVLR